MQLFTLGSGLNPPTVIDTIQSHQTTNPPSKLCDDKGLEVIISMTTLRLATKGIIMEKVFGCRLSEEAWRRISDPETMRCFALTSVFFFSFFGQGKLGQESDALPQAFPRLSLCILCPFCTL